MLYITRGSTYADKLRNYTILLDEEYLGVISDGESTQYKVSPGQHEIRIKIDWGGSQTIKFNVAKSEDQEFYCINALTGSKVVFAVFYAFFMPRRYVHLEQILPLKP